MTFRHRLAAALIVSFLLCAPAIVNSQAPKKPPAKPAPAQKKPQMQTVAGTVIFAVNKYEDSVTLDPIVIFNKGQYIDPLPDENEAFVKQVATKFLRAGQKHRVIFGGAEAGTVTVKERFESEIGLTTSATLQSSIKLSDEVKALATSSDALGGKQNSRRAPTPEERAAMMNLMSESYKQKKVQASAIAKVQVNNITAIDVDADGQAELIGSFEISDQNQNSQNLFLIAEMKSNQYQSGLTWYKSGGESDSEVRRLIDVLDLDGDGLAEVFAMSSYYESTDFTIYKKVKGVWRSVYQGGLFGV
jgi:hypothetical protein